MSDSDRIRQLEQERDEALTALAEAQQWIDSEPGWKAKYFSVHLAMTRRARAAELTVATLREKVEAAQPPRRSEFQDTRVTDGWNSAKARVLAILDSAGTL